MATEKITRAEAQAKGLKRFYTGEPCMRGHTAERQTTNGRCIICSKETSRNYRERNPEKTRALTRKYKKEHPEWTKERRKARYDRNPARQQAVNADWLARNPEYRNKYAKEWRERNPEKEKARRHARRARKQSGGHHSAADLRDIYRMQKEKCALCRVKLKGKYHVDHIISLVRGGSNQRSNIQILCAPCNVRKSSLDQIDFMRSRGRLL